MQQETKLLNDSYLKIRKINQGGYGKIYFCQVLKEVKRSLTFPFQNDQKEYPKFKSYVILKKFQPIMSKKGMDIDTIREVKFLQYFNHPNIVSISDIFLKQPSQGSKKYEDTVYKRIFIVMDFMLPLSDLIYKKNLVYFEFTPEDIKIIMYQLLSGLNYLHEQSILHRDIKPSNILLSKNAEIKITDFGLARESKLEMTKRTCTLNYRAPELLFSESRYSEKIDVWSAGCTFAELFLRKIFFAGDTPSQVMNQIVSYLGNPTQENWPGWEQLPQVMYYEERQPRNFKKILVNLCADGVDLIKKMLNYNPDYRPTVYEVFFTYEQQFIKCLIHPYFNDIQNVSKAHLQQEIQKFYQSQISEYTKK